MGVLNKLFDGNRFEVKSLRKQAEKVDSYREYIKETYSYIEELDGKVKRADAEEVAWKFQVNLSNIQKVEYTLFHHFPREYFYFNFLNRCHKDTH